MKALDVVLRDHVTPLLTDAGFRKSGKLYRRRADNGDEALVGFKPYKLGEREAEFHVDAGVLPKPQAEWLTQDGGSTSIASVLWEERLKSPANRLGIWQFDLTDTASIDQLRAGLRDLAGQLVHLLDRRNLVELVRDPATPSRSLRQFPRERALALVLSDQGSSAELEDALRAVERHNPDDPVAAWIRARVT